MPVQSIDLSSSTTAATFNGATVDKINLNGTQIWAKPSAGGVFYSLTGTDSTFSTSTHPYILVNSAAANAGAFYYIRRSDGKLFEYAPNVGTNLQYTYALCVYGCGWAGTVATTAYLHRGAASTSGPAALYTAMTTVAIYT